MSLVEGELLVEDSCCRSLHRCLVKVGLGAAGQFQQDQIQVGRSALVSGGIDPCAELDQCA